MRYFRSLALALGLLASALYAWFQPTQSAAESPGAGSQKVSVEAERKRTTASNKATDKPRARLARRHRGITAQLDCSACHSEASWKMLSGVRGSRGGFDHSQTGFPLTGEHQSAACTDCHQAERTISRDCSSCHRDPHKRRLGQNCSECHSARGWFDTRAIARHRSSRLPLTGVHALLDCSECHQRAAGAASEFAWVPAACFACHADDYRDPTIHPPHTGTAGDLTKPPFPRDCAFCHRASGWVPAFVQDSLFETRFGTATSALRVELSHDRFFRLSNGPHRGAPCGDCHLSPDIPKATTCNGCHAHNQVQLAKQHQGIVGFGARCLTCHPGGLSR